MRTEDSSFVIYKPHAYLVLLNLLTQSFLSCMCRRDFFLRPRIFTRLISVSSRSCLLAFYTRPSFKTDENAWNVTKFSTLLGKARGQVCAWKPVMHNARGTSAWISLEIRWRFCKSFSKYTLPGSESREGFSLALYQITITQIIISNAI